MPLAVAVLQVLVEEWDEALRMTHNIGVYVQISTSMEVR